ncbi:MAG: response regulator [Balneolales bacterium]
MKHILIIEDEYIIALSLYNYLIRHGYAVTSGIIDGSTAIRAVKQNHYDLILMDVKLEGCLDGIETMAKIRTFSSIPVIYIADVSDKSTQERADKTNPVAYVSKPFDYEELIEAIEQSWKANPDKTGGKPPSLLLLL